MVKEEHTFIGNLQNMAKLLYDLTRTAGIRFMAKGKPVEINTADIARVKVVIYVEKNESGLIIPKHSHN